LWLGQTLSATNGLTSPAGSLYGGNPASVLVTGVTPTTISYTVTGGTATTPVAGTVTNIIATEQPPSSYSQQSIYKFLYPNSNI